MSGKKQPGWVAGLSQPGSTKTPQHRFSISGSTSSSALGKSTSLAPKGSAEVAVQATGGLVSDRLRLAMVDRIAQKGVTDRLVMEAMRKVPRHHFVDEGLASRAYEDTALPIGHGQTISQPFIVARMIEILNGGRTLRTVLEIGTGCGYQAAVLGQVSSMVITVERIRALHDMARQLLRPFRLSNVRLHFGDGREGYADAAPFDGIILAAAGLGIPEPLLHQLAIGGRLIAPVVAQGGAQRLVQVDRISQHEWKSTELDGVNFVPLRSGVS
jgi:protein-L-isoaspartate(D-aspartate) O-methyltransferase